MRLAAPIPTQRLNLDDLSTVLRQQHAAMGASDALRHVQNFKASEGKVVEHRLLRCVVWIWGVRERKQSMARASPAIGQAFVAWTYRRS